MTRVMPSTRPEQGAEDPNPAPCDPVPDGLVERVLDALHADES